MLKASFVKRVKQMYSMGVSFNRLKTVWRWQQDFLFWQYIHNLGCWPYEGMWKRYLFSIIKGTWKGYLFCPNGVHRVIIHYLLTEREVITGKSQTEALMYWPSDSGVNTIRPLEVWDFLVMTERTRLISYLLYGLFSAILKRIQWKHRKKFSTSTCARYGFLRRSYLRSICIRC